MPKQREKMTEVHSCGSPPFSTCLGAVASFIISQGQKCHKKPFPLVYHQSHKEKSVKGGHRPQRLPLILFFVGYNAGGENGCPSVSLLPPVLHCPFRRKKDLQASEAISQAEEWKNRAEKSEIQIQKLLSEKQELVSTVAEQGKRIAEQTEQIEKLNEADNVLKLNAELKKQNEKLKQDKLNAEQEAEATVSSVKREYEAKGRELDRRIGEAAKQSASLKSERQSISEDIEQRATAKYLDQKKELDRKFKAQTASYDSFLLGLLLYGVLTTVFTAVRSEAFVSDFKTFFMVIWQFIVNAFQLLLKGGQWASQLGDKIPQPVVATIVHYLLLIVFVGGIAIGVGFLIFLGASKVFEFYTEDYADTMSLAVFLISLAVSVYFAEPIRAVIPINLLLLLILVHIVYVLIRWYVKGCMRSRGYY